MQNQKLPRSDSTPRGENVWPLEPLEPRQLLSGAAMEGGGLLVVQGTAGNDTITVSRDPANAADLRVLLNGQSFDFPASAVKRVKVDGGRGNDLIQSDTSHGAINAGMFFLGDAGSDTLVSATADDALVGGGENDVLLARAGNNYINGGAGNDKIFAGAGNDTLVGEGGADYLSDAGGKNTVVAPSASDIVITAPLPTVIPTANSPIPVPPSSEHDPVPPPTPPPPVATDPKSPFVIGVWSQPYWSFDKWKARGINTVVGYESMSGTVSVEKFSDAAVKSGLFMIRHPNPDPAKDVGQKNLLAWMLNDEPDYHNTPVQTLVDQYKRLKTADADLPVFVNFSGSSALWGYGGKFEADYKRWLAASDWVGNDLYPITAHNRPSALDAPGLAVERLSQWSGGKRQFAVIEASDQQLPGHPDYPGVTADQFRAEVFNAVIGGATGIIYFPQRIGNGFSYDAMNPQVEAEMKAVDARLARIGPALMTAEDPSGVNFTVSGNLRTTWRRYNGKTYVVVLNNSSQATTTTMKISGVSATSANVDGENRTAPLHNGQLTDSFKPYEAHVYVVG